MHDEGNKGGPVLGMETETLNHSLSMCFGSAFITGMQAKGGYSKRAQAAHRNKACILLLTDVQTNTTEQISPH